MRIFSGGLRNASLADEYSRAILLAESRLAELGAQPVEGEKEGEFDDKYHWRSTAHPWPDDANTLGMGAQPLPVRLMEIEVRVAWGDAGGGRSREIALSTLRLAPAPGP